MRNSAFRRLWLTSGASAVALSAYLLFEQWYVVRELGEPSALGAVMAATVASRLLLMSVGGVLVDRFRAARVAAWSATSRLALVLVMVGFLQAGWLTVTTVLVFGVLYGACDAFFSPAVTSLAPRLVPGQQLRAANAALHSTNQGGMIAGPLLGAAVLALSFTAALVAVAALLVVAAASVAWLQEPQHTRRAPGTRLLDEALTGLRHLRTVRGAWQNLLIIVAVNLVFMGPLLMGIPLLVAADPAATPADLGVLQGAYAAGMIAGAGVAALAGDRLWLVRALLPFLGACLVGVGLLPHLWQVGLMAAMGIASSVINVLIITHIQRATDPEIIGRVMAFVTIASSGTLPVSYAVLGALVGAGLPVAAVIVGAGALVLLLGAGFAVGAGLAGRRTPSPATTR
ncbi:MFS transporter [Georgenia sp. TF02-10]|uniref:MFS transporter n=1 Tax=Georgenia sp. TF02-10 TaxID=2917725 RepID=UPI001FA7087D|nr:MFS transporter [Georgenia sp. TF02-10]UNX53675.1 MFS transporter [Georgenia sp. TF02-10]